MPQFQPTPRTMFSEVLFDLEEMEGELQESAYAIDAIKKACDHELRRLARINRVRRNAIEHMHKALAAMDEENVVPASWSPTEVAA